MAETISHPDSVPMPDVTIPCQWGDLPTCVARPQIPGPWPGVVIIHDAGGMKPDIRSQAEWLASEGFLAAAPDLFHWGGTIRCLRQIARDFGERKGRSFDEIDAVRTWLTQQEGCSGKIGIIGFCMGGGFALMLAPGRGFSASSVNYGGHLPKDVETFLAAACPIVASYGAKDMWNRGVAQELETLLTKLEVPHDVKEYSDAGHSFLNDHKDAWFRALKIIRISYHEPSARDARRRIAAFFHAHLRT